MENEMRWGNQTYPYPPGPRPSDTAHIKKKGVQISRDEINRALGEYLEEGGSIETIVVEWDE